MARGHRYLGTFGALRLGALAVALIILFAAMTSAAEAKRHKKPGPVVTVTQIAPIAPGASATATVACPAGTTVVGGGYSTTPLSDANGVLVYESRRVGNSWIATGVRPSGATGFGAVTVEAYCRKHVKPATEASGFAVLPAYTPGSFGTGTAVARCPAGEKPVAGGFRGNAPLPLNGVVLPASSHRTSDNSGWEAAGINSQAVSDGMIAYAYCAKRGLTEVGSPITVPDGIGFADSPPCPKVKVRVHGKKKKRRSVPLALGFATSATSPTSLTIALSAQRSLGAHFSYDHAGGTAETFTSYAYCGV
jgi:hypothetical protein